MVAGHLQEKNGIYYIVLSYNDAEGERKTKWSSTSLPIRGNKKRAEALLMKARKEFEPIPQVKESDISFADFMTGWLAMMKERVELSTYAAYQSVITTRVVPYFQKHSVTLEALSPKQISDYYQFMMETYSVKATTIARHHANIRKALQYAVKMGLIDTNPADKVERPKQQKFVGSFYDVDELQQLFQVVKGTRIEFAVLMGAFYGLRRSEVVGLRWSSIDFQNHSISIEHTVTSARIDGQLRIISKDRTKNASSCRSLPLVPEFEALLLRMKSEQANNRKICLSSYCNDFSDYIYVDELGHLVKPDYITQNFAITIRNSGLRKIRFHDLRHSCASLLLANGVQMKNIQEWLGHSSYSTTANIYTHLDYNSKIASASKMESVLPISSSLHIKREIT